MTTSERMKLATEESRLLKSMTPEQFEQSMRIGGRRRMYVERQRNWNHRMRSRRTLDDTAARMRAEAELAAEVRYLENHFGPQA